MATYDSTVRLRQLNKPELSGYIIEVIGEIPNTGELVNSFYPLNSNPNSYITTGQTGNFITQEELDSNYYSTLIYVGNNYYPLSNPYNYISSNAALVYSTGNQNISGVKNFYTRPTVNGTGVLLIGESSGANVNLQNVVYTTGNQQINGTKNFADGIQAGSFYGDFCTLQANSTFVKISSENEYGLSFSPNNFYLINQSGFIDLFSGRISGFGNISAKEIYQSGVKVATVEDLNSVIGFDLQNVVYKTGDQTIDGIKNFLKRPTVNGTGILLSGEAGNITITGIGSGYQIYSEYSDGNHNFRSISGVTGINISLSNDKKVLNLNITGLVFKTDTGNFVTTGQTGNFLTTYSNVVYVDGNQIISGNKTFQNALTLNTQATTINHAVKASRNISAGNGLIGGGDLTFDRTLIVKPDYGISVTSNGVSINDEVVVTTTKEQNIFENKKIYGKLKDSSITFSPDYTDPGPEDGTEAKYNYNQNSLFSFYVYEYQNQGGVKIYSKPIHFYKELPAIAGNTFKYFATFSWPKSETASGYHILVDQDIQAGITNGLLNPVSGIIIPNKNITGIEVGKISGIGYVTSPYSSLISGYYQDFRYLGIPDFNYSNALDVIGNFKINSGSFDVDSKINYFLPSLTTENPEISFVQNALYKYDYGYDFIFYLYGYKTIEGETIYSSPIQFTGYPKIWDQLPVNYRIKIEWTPNSFYDGYLFLVDQDILFGISGGLQNTQKWGAYLDKNLSSVTIGETSEEGIPPNNYGYITEISSYYENFFEFPNLKYSKLIGSEIHITTGIDNKIIISGQTLFNKRPMVNGTGVLLSGEVVGNNVNIENVVYTTGTQTVVGKKTFSNVLSANVLKTNWIISEDNVQYGQLGSLSNFIGERAGVQDNSSIINNVNFIGYEAGFDIRGLNINSNLIGNSAGLSSNNIESSNFIGYQAGLSTIDSYESNFIGYQAGSSSYQNIRSNFIGYLAGGGDESSSNYDSNYIGNQAGYYSSLCQNSNFIGYEAGAYAIGCSFSNFLGNGAGAGSVGSTSSVFIGSFAGNSTFNCYNSIFIGKSAGYQNIYTLPPYDSFSLLIGNYTSGKLNSIAIGQGAANSTEKQLNLANVIYATNINTGITPSSTPVLNGKVGILNDNPQYTLDVSGDCRITGQTVFAIRPTVNGSGVLLEGEGGGPSSDISIYQIRFFT